MPFWETAETLKLILATIPNGVFIIDRDGVIRVWNRQMEALTGYQEADVLGRSYKFLVCQDDSLPNEVGRCPILDGGQESIEAYECKVNARNGEHIPVLRNASAIRDEQGGVIGAIQSVTDLRPTLKLQQEVVALRQGTHRSRQRRLIGKSPAMQQVFEQIQLAADSEATVLLLGETGTGKELVVEEIHNLGGRQDKPLVKVNCSALPEGLLESELFGHVKGAFTGAIQDKIGRFERANGGTIFLDEIGEISPLIQLKLLRVLQERVIERVGDSVPRSIDVRVVAATHRDLKQLVEDRTFRQDLYYRLRVFPISLPPLRQRLTDIPLLITHFIDRFNRETGKSIRGVDPSVMTALTTACWPGNVRELENAIEHAFVTCRGDTIELNHLPADIRQPDLRDADCRRQGDTAELQPVEASSMEGAPAKANTPTELRALLDAHNWKRAEVADALGISRVTLWRKMKQWQIAQ